jgi:hypothetical protein
VVEGTPSPTTWVLLMDEEASLRDEGDPASRMVIPIPKSLSSEVLLL